MPMMGPRSWDIGSLDGAIMWCGHDGFSSAPPVGLGKAAPTVIIKQPMSDASVHPGMSVSRRLTFDPLEIGRMTGHSYAGRGYVSFGFFGLNNSCSKSYSEFKNGFYEVIDCEDELHRFPEYGGEANAVSVADWLGKLRKPTGIFATNDVKGLMVLQTAQHLGLAVPREVAVIAVGDDEVLCALADPPLSSICLNGMAAGMIAAGMLQELMQLSEGPGLRVVLRNGRVVERASSNLSRIADDAISRAVDFIRERATSSINVADVVAVSGLSRRVLETRFKKKVGCTLHVYLTGVRLEAAKNLLVESSYSVSEIAQLCGFAEPQRLCEVFDRRLGLSPREYRQREGSPGGP